MNKSALQDIQQALNTIRSEIERVDDETKWAALELMLGTSSSVVALAKKMAKPETKTVTRTVDKTYWGWPSAPDAVADPYHVRYI